MLILTYLANLQLLKMLLLRVAWQARDFYQSQLLPSHFAFYTNFRSLPSGQKSFNFDSDIFAYSVLMSLKESSWYAYAFFHSFVYDYLPSFHTKIIRSSCLLQEPLPFPKLVCNSCSCPWIHHRHTTWKQWKKSRDKLMQSFKLVTYDYATGVTATS